MKVYKPITPQARPTSEIVIGNSLLIKTRWPKCTVNEQRLILYGLSLVNKWDKDLKIYRIAIKDLKNILGCKNNTIYDDFEVATDNLMKKVIQWYDSEYAIKKVTWCSYAAVTKDRKFVELAFNPYLKPFLIALKNNFTCCELIAVLKVKNHYSLRIYQLMKFHQGIKSKIVKIHLNKLKEYLCISKDQYDNFHSFEKRVLNPVQKDISKNTDLIISFTSDNKGRGSKKTENIIFSFKQNKTYKNRVKMEAERWPAATKKVFSYDQLPLFKEDILPEAAINPFMQYFKKKFPSFNQQTAKHQNTDASGHR
jgi:plasmid replication initiation protein